MTDASIVGEFSVLSPSQKMELERKRREQEAREAEEATRRAEEERKKREDAQRVAAAKKAAAEKARQKKAQKLRDLENAKSSKITVWIIAGIGATIFLIWSFVKLYNILEGSGLFGLCGSFLWLGGIFGVWSLVIDSIKHAKDNCEREIKHLRGKW